MPERITRILAILRSLSEDDVEDVEHLANQLGISRRTVFRDFKILRSVGIRIEFDRPVRRYRIDQKIVPQLPTPEDLAELLRQATATALPVSKRQRLMAQRATTILSTHLPTNLRNPNRLFSNSIQSTVENYSKEICDIFSTIGKAIAYEKCVHLQIYCEESNLNASWEVQPQRLSFAENGWLLEGIFFIDHKNFRVALEKVITVGISGEPFVKKLDLTT